MTTDSKLESNPETAKTILAQSPEIIPNSSNVEQIQLYVSGRNHVEIYLYCSFLCKALHYESKCSCIVSSSCYHEHEQVDQFYQNKKSLQHRLNTIEFYCYLYSVRVELLIIMISNNLSCLSSYKLKRILVRPKHSSQSEVVQRTYWAHKTIFLTVAALKEGRLRRQMCSKTSCN